MLISDEYNKFELLRELQEIHKIMNSRVDAPLLVEAMLSDKTLTSEDSGKTFLVNTASARTITLPAPASGLYFTFKDKNGTAATNNITIKPRNFEKIDGAATKVINTNNGSVHLTSDGEAWHSF